MQPDVSIKERADGAGIVLVGVGSNLGDRQASITLALDMIDRDPGSRVTSVSSLYETVPVNAAGGDFLNAVAVVETTLTPTALLGLFKSIERGLGRTGRSGDARPIDLDILFFDDRIIMSDGLTVPHPRWRDRDFVLVPLLDVCGGMLDPRTGERLFSLASAGLRKPADVRVFRGPDWFHGRFPRG